MGLYRRYRNTMHAIATPCMHVQNYFARPLCGSTLVFPASVSHHHVCDLPLFNIALQRFGDILSHRHFSTSLFCDVIYFSTSCFNLTACNTILQQHSATYFCILAKNKIKTHLNAQASSECYVQLHAKGHACAVRRGRRPVRACREPAR